MIKSHYFCLTLHLSGNTATVITMHVYEKITYLVLEVISYVVSTTVDSRTSIVTYLCVYLLPIGRSKEGEERSMQANPGGH